MRSSQETRMLEYLRLRECQAGKILPNFFSDSCMYFCINVDVKCMMQKCESVTCVTDADTGVCIIKEGK